VLAQQNLDPSTVARLQGEVDVRRATLCFYAGDYTGSMAASLSALAQIPHEWWLLRAQARLFLSASYQASGQLEQAYATLYDSGEPAHGPAFQMRLLVDACFIHWLAADLWGLDQAARQILERDDQVALQVETTTWARYHLGICHYERNELADAERQLAVVVRQRYQTHVRCYLNSAVALALIYVAQDQAEKAQEIATQMVSFALEVGGAIGLAITKAFESELALRQGRLAEAVYWAEHNEMPLSVPLPLFYRPPITLAKILLAQDTSASRQRAAQVLADLSSYAAAIHHTSVLIEVLALQVLLYEAENQRLAALRILQQALDLAEPGGFIRMFVDLGAPMERLMAALLQERKTYPYAARVLAAFPQKLAPTNGHRQANAALLSPLTARELEVLALLAKHHTDSEIGAELVISRDTVHSHVQHIAEKLGVRGRRAIVQAARAQSIIGE
jgi:LuxR family maltose regulon positive regulatory protein